MLGAVAGPFTPRAVPRGAGTLLAGPVGTGSEEEYESSRSSTLVQGETARELPSLARQRSRRVSRNRPQRLPNSLLPRGLAPPTFAAGRQGIERVQPVPGHFLDEGRGLRSWFQSLTC